ncbi:alcohol dehydrogenase [Capronia coronata CBS 617.96]|uniref:Alcohol dehydrogenase n=1 Tax=Capronia coronata CBS 617.96 TaxID=1182541 RepID=W9ZM36_9EURO|nr:alcohol dehydrogenase [Capronia coronata CBS 617.96]EXJ95554.1 alcohol dehydrogenase [Capronia coronata CBS 617.96]
MSVPKTTESWVIQGSNGFDSLKLEKNRPVGEVGDHDCAVQIHAVSLNYRDLIIPKGMYPFPMALPVVPCSDAAGTVIAVGKKVTEFKVGDKVCTLFNQLHQAGPISPRAMQSGLGGAIDGTLRKVAVFPEHGLVKAPSTISPIEASTLTCAPLTAWNALYGLQSKALKPGDFVLTQGTGGVSLAAIQFAAAAGATVIATTSSDEKGKKLKELGAHHVINYRTTPNWGEVARSLTPDGVGVDHIVEVGGAGTLTQSLKAIKLEGTITIIGFLGGVNKEDMPSLLDALNNICTVRGILVGSRQQFEEMNRAIEANGIHPVVDKKIFKFENAVEAYQYQWDQKHFGKVVIQV